MNGVHKVLTKIDERKSVGIDKMPNKLLKIAASIVAPLSTCSKL